MLGIINISKTALTDANHKFVPCSVTRSLEVQQRTQRLMASGTDRLEFNRKEEKI